MSRKRAVIKQWMYTESYKSKQFPIEIIWIWENSGFFFSFSFFPGLLRTFLSMLLTRLPTTDETVKMTWISLKYDAPRLMSSFLHWVLSFMFYLMIWPKNETKSTVSYSHHWRFNFTEMDWVNQIKIQL